MCKMEGKKINMNRLFAKTKIEDLSEIKAKELFVASYGWWHRSQHTETNEQNLASENLVGEAGTADIKAAEECAKCDRRDKATKSR